MMSNKVWPIRTKDSEQRRRRRASPKMAIMRPSLKPVIALVRSRGQVRSFASNINEAKLVGIISYGKYLLSRGSAVALGCYIGHIMIGPEVDEIEQAYEELSRMFEKRKATGERLEKLYEDSLST